MTPGTVTRIKPEDLLEQPEPEREAPRMGLPRRRQVAGVVLATVGLPLLTLLLDSARSELSLESVVLLFLLVVVLTALVGGVAVALPAAVAAALLINYFFTEPIHTLDVAERDQALWATAFYAGLRRGELMALRIADVDLAGGVIRVERAWDAKGREYVETKSRAGRRTVPIPAVLRDYLDEHVLRLGWGEGLYLVTIRSLTRPRPETNFQACSSL